MKRTRFIQLFTSLLLAACALQEAQAIERINDGGNWTKENSWYENRQSSEKTSFADGKYVRFYKRDDGLTKYYVNISSNVNPVGIDVGTDYTFRFIVENGNNVRIRQQLNQGLIPQFLVQKGCTLTLKKTEDSTGAGKGVLTVYNVGDRTDEKGLAGAVVVGDQTIFRIQNTELTPSDYVGYLAGTASITVKNGGEFVLNHSLWLTDDQAIKRDYYHADVYGNRTTGGDYFDKAYDYAYFDFIHKEAGGKLTIANGVKITTKDGVNYMVDTTTGNAVNYNDKSIGDMTTFYKHGDGVATLSSIYARAGASLRLVDMTAGTLSVDQLISSVTVNTTGGTLAFQALGGVGIVNVNGDINVSGDTNPEGKVYNIAPLKKITFADNLQMQGVSFVGEGGTKVTIQNTTGSVVKYALSEQGALLSADKITMTAGATGNVTVGNKVAAATVENQGTHTLTLGNGDSAVKEVFATSGNIIFHNMGESAISLKEMTIGEGKQVGFYKGQGLDAAAEATVSISQSLTAGTGAALLSNLVLETNSHLDLDGGQMYLGGELTLGTNIGLDQDTLDAIAKLENIGDVHKLFINYPETVITNSNDGDWARDHFDLSSITDADYKITVGENGAYVGLVKVSNVPEPTTGTLSLLALCALTARRRRRN